ncbi:MAG: hypothetical protein JSS09_02250 [Verrucomicrobia bacterium]|nr:hypothetical protein [Verrucomicrobiota bacterium]
MSFITLVTKSACLLRQSFHPSEAHLKVTERKISDFSKTIISQSNMDKKKIMSFEEFSQKRHGSLEDFIKRMKPAFPDSTNDMFKDAYKRSCECGYRTYKRAVENPSNNIGLMLQSDFFEDESS